MGKSHGLPDTDVEHPLIFHLLELRSRLLKAIFGILLVFLGLSFYANEIYSHLAGPLTAHLPAGASMIAIDVASPFFTPFKLALILSIFSSVPLILYQFWAFVAPGLYRHEKKLILPLLLASTLLFYLGMAFAYFVVFPLIFGFLTAAAPEGVEVMTDISRYLDFVLTLFFAFGVCFQVPIATILLVWTGIVTPKMLAEQRRYVILGAFVIAMFLTPPDAISQTLLAVPMCLLFELGILCSRIFVPRDVDDRVSDAMNFELLKDLWGFMRVRKKFWLAPIIVVLLLLGALIVLSEGSAVAPFIYTLF